MVKRQKYGNKKREYNGLKFDSTLELYCYQMLERFKIPFKFQVRYELQPSFKSWKEENVRSIYMKVDFVIKLEDKWIFIDTKGFATDTAKMKYKMLEYQYQKTGREYEVWWLKNKKEVKNYVIGLYDDLKKKK
jgi:hypothetical protein